MEVHKKHFVVAQIPQFTVRYGQIGSIFKNKFPFPGTITPSGRVLTCAPLQSEPAK